MPTNQEIIEWARADGVRQVLEETGLQPHIVDAGVMAEATERQALVLGSVSQRAWELEQDIRQREIKMLEEKAGLEEIKGSLGNLQGYLDTSPDVESEKVEEIDFAPFSIITKGIKDGAIHDEVYIKIRDMVEDILFAPTSKTCRFQDRKIYRTIAGNTIKQLVMLARTDVTYRDTINARIVKAHELGFEVHPGQGISFLDPKRIIKAVENGDSPTTRYNPLRPRLIKFAARLTSSV